MFPSNTDNASGKPRKTFNKQFKRLSLYNQLPIHGRVISEHDNISFMIKFFMERLQTFLLNFALKISAILALATILFISL